MNDTAPNTPKPSFLTSAVSIWSQQSLSWRDRFGLIRQGAKLWQDSTRPQVDPESLLCESVSVTRCIPVRSRSIFAQAFVVHAPAYAKLDEDSSPLCVSADRIDAPGARMTTPAAGLLIAESLLPEDRVAFLSGSLAKSRVLQNALERADTRETATGYLARAFRMVNRDGGDLLARQIQQGLDQRSLEYVNRWANLELSRTALNPAGLAQA